LKINGAFDLTMATGQSLQMTNGGGVLKTGGGTSTINGGLA